MDDLISRQAAIQAVMDLPDCPNGYSDTYDKACIIGLLEEAPSAERHGKWLNGYGFAGNYFDCFVCNQCKKESMAKTNYCPNCGARMDEVAQNDIR